MRGRPVRKPILYAASATVVLGIGVLIWHFVLAGDPFGAVGLRSTVHVLCATTSGGVRGEGVDSVSVLTVDRGRVGLLFVPADLWMKSDDGSSGTLGDLAVRGGWAAACRAAGALLGVSVSRYVVFDEADLSAFLALFPSVDVSVSDGVTGADPTAPGGAELRISAGRRTLDPREMQVFLCGTSRAIRAERDRQAFEAIVRGRPAADESFQRGVRAVAEGLETNLSPHRCAELWTGIARASEMASAVLPSREVVEGGAVRRLPVVTETEQVVASIVRGAEPLTPARVAVAVFNGNGVRLSASRAAGYLRARGFRVSATANAEAFSYATSYIVVLTAEAKAWMLREALPEAAEVVSPEEFAQHYEALRGQVPQGTDLIFVVGAGMEFGG